MLNLDTAQRPMLGELWRKHRNMLIYGVIGASAVVIDLGLFVVLHEMSGVEPWIAHTVSVGVAVVWSFVLNAFFNFGTTDRLMTRFLSFAGVSFVGYLIGLAIIALATGVGVGGTVAKIASMPVVFIAQYVLNTRISFRSHS